MGRVFLEHPGGSRIFSCAHCDTALTNRNQLISMRFTGATGRAFLFRKVVNLTFSEVQNRVMLTGRHMVRDVACKNCSAKLGWIYEYATEEEQRYKEGRVILERALVTETDGIDEIHDWCRIFCVWLGEEIRFYWCWNFCWGTVGLFSFFSIVKGIVSKSHNLIQGVPQKLYKNDTFRSIV